MKGVLLSSVFLVEVSGQEALGEKGRKTSEISLFVRFTKLTAVPKTMQDGKIINLKLVRKNLPKLGLAGVLLKLKAHRNLGLGGETA